MAMLTTPERSHITPDNAPYTRGVVDTSVSASKSTKLSVAPRAAQVNSAQINSTTPNPKIR